MEIYLTWTLWFFAYLGFGLVLLVICNLCGNDDRDESFSEGPSLDYLIGSLLWPLAVIVLLFCLLLTIKEKFSFREKLP